MELNNPSLLLLETSKKYVLKNPEISLFRNHDLTHENQFYFYSSYLKIYLKGHLSTSIKCKVMYNF